MTNPLLALQGVTHVLPDGRALFSDLDAHFDLRPTGLVGRNGVGKTCLLHILSGELAPSAGRCLSSGRVHRLDQQVSINAEDSVAHLAGIHDRLAALTRIEHGSTDPTDFDRVGTDWDIAQRLHNELAHQGLDHLAADTPAHRLSGGERMRVALIGALLSAPDFLLLDEPSNHLDAGHRQALIRQLRQWPRGLLVVSHDRELLDSLDRIVELSPSGLHSYGGNYTAYAQQKALETDAARERLARHKLERQRGEQAIRAQQQRQERRQAAGKRHARTENQASILLGGRKNRSEDSQGRLRQQQAATREQLDQQVRDAADALREEAEISLNLPAGIDASRRKIVDLENIELPHVPPTWRHINLHLRGGQRVGVVGPNGCGKSTLLKVVADHWSALSGSHTLHVPCAWLDQHLTQLDPQRSALDLLRECHPDMPRDLAHRHLAQLGLPEHTATRPSGQLSGGERLKTALACTLHATPPPQLLLLDEPGNHLDLPSLQALEAILNAYPGSLMVVSHDARFLDALALTDRLEATPDGWRLTPWSNTAPHPPD